ncbi:coiled-coil domain-containing protein 42-like isoform X2 [Cynoglossus semilaevis]|uniref:coiled-coil domain-containing protein 42-like isoform X2 n=1 Tax=Cynoglossus semilaevis TaxID=244447 RepID=UPI0007DCB0D8|nr:coiled-coil domain-containing protein 42-like isoform X2 [Cynoglossus semilaevis]
MNESTAVIGDHQQFPHSVLSAARTKSAMILEVQKKRNEDKELKGEILMRHLLENLHKNVNELHKDHAGARQLHSSFDMFLKDEDAAKTVEKAEQQRREVLQKKEQIQILKKEKAKLEARKQKLHHHLLRLTVYQVTIEQVVKMTKFKHAQLVVDHLESQFHLREQLCQREKEAQEQAEQQRKAVATLDDQHNLMQLQMNNQLAKLQTKLEETRSEAVTWERKWNHIQETAAKKTLLLGQIKMATLNLYEMTSDALESEEVENMENTEKQLYKIQMFIQDYKDIVQQHTQRGTEKKLRHKCSPSQLQKHL